MMNKFFSDLISKSKEETQKEIQQAALLAQQKEEADAAERGIWLAAELTKPRIKWLIEKEASLISVAMNNTQNKDLSNEFLVQARTIRTVINYLTKGKE